MTSAVPRVAVGGVVLAYVGDADRSVLLVLRGRPPNAGGWSLPGGRVELGETLHAALAREILEETALVVRVAGLVEVIELIEGDFHYVILDYACEVMSGSLRAGSDAIDAAWVPVAELDRYAVSDAVKDVVDKALRFARAEAGAT